MRNIWRTLIYLASARYSRYQELLERFKVIDPRSVLEIGVWRGDRSVKFLELSPQLKQYVGFDLFGDMTDDIHEREAMGGCVRVTFENVSRRLARANKRHVDIKLVRGNTKDTLPEFVASCQSKFDFVLIDGGHGLDTIDNDWRYASAVLDERGTCVLDDYYLETAAVGCKRLIDGLDASVWRKEFFRGIEKTVEGHYITMVAVSGHLQRGGTSP